VKMIKRAFLPGMVPAGLCATLLSAPGAMAATAADPAPMAPYGGGASVAGHAAVGTGGGGAMHSWEIALIAMATAVVITIADRALTRARAARHPLAGAG
jgi:hypothetical protein